MFLAAHQAVEGIHKRLGSGHHHIGVSGMTGIQTAVLAQANRHLTHGIDAFSDGFHAEFHQFIGDLNQAIEGLANSINRPGANGSLGALLTITGAQGDRGCGAQISPTTHLHSGQLVVGLDLLGVLPNDGLQIAVGDLSLAISEFFKASEGIVEVITIELIPQLLKACADGTATTELAQADAVIGQADGSGINDFVGEAVLQHTVLVDAGFMGKGIGTHDGFVGLHRHAGEVGDQARGFVNLLGLDAC